MNMVEWHKTADELPPEDVPVKIVGRSTDKPGHIEGTPWIVLVRQGDAYFDVDRKVTVNYVPKMWRLLGGSPFNLIQKNI